MRAPPPLAVARNGPPTVGACNCIDDRQPEAGPSALARPRAVSAIEPIEYRVEGLGRKAGTVIGDRELDFILVFVDVDFESACLAGCGRGRWRASWPPPG